MTIDIAARMSELVGHLQSKGIGGIRFCDIEPESEAQWSKDYAIVCNAYSPDLFGMDDHDYFDHTQLQWEFQQFVKKWFEGDDSLTIKLWGLFDGCSEIEVYREEKDTDNANRSL